MYAFPNLILPEKFVKDCESKGKVADAVYCMGILEETGIVVVPCLDLAKSTDVALPNDAFTHGG